VGAQVLFRSKTVLHEVGDGQGRGRGLVVPACY
jgi:hypothetical protein